MVPEFDIVPELVIVIPDGIVIVNPDGIVTVSPELIVIEGLESPDDAHVAGSFQFPLFVAVKELLACAL